ncbi:type IV pilus biogenesis protein PilM [Moorella sp. E306M]|uniref:type IV pilus biogenesis protein PilM n=1 Tax=Moorella sp. E306M TaxID=2572683 RepID=UPI0010FFB34C|nr:pilus assembly protein PilM [Moorella sp. E306M]GEA19171.1 pilus-associated protein pilM [Moorella sp. E306M]
MRWPRFKRQPQYLGIDLGTTAVKAAVYQGRQWLTASVPTPQGGLADTQAMVAAVAEAASRTGWRGRRAVTAVSGERVIVRYLRLPRMTPEELKSGMAYEIENYLPTGARDMVVDWAILDAGNDAAADQMPVLLAAAPREQVTGLYQLFHAAGLDLVAIDLVPLALCRALAEEAGGSTVIIDIGGRWSNLVLAREGQPLFSRVVAIGGGELGQPGISGSSRMAELAQEIRRSLEFYRSQAGTAFNPERIILTGGGAQVEGLVDYYREELGVTVIIGRPGTGFNGSPDPALAVAMGLALREREI